MAVTAVVGAGHAFHAILLQAVFAGGAVAAGIHHATDTHHISDFKAADIVAHGGHMADDLVAGDHRVQGAAPVVFGEMNIGVADAAVINLDRHVVRARRAPLDGHGVDPGLRALRAVGFNLAHGDALPFLVLNYVNHGDG